MKRHYFNSRPHGGRHENSEWTTSMFTFQLTPSRRATTEMWWAAQQAIFQLTPSRRATYFEGISTPPDGISTHALTEGGFPLQEKSFSNPLFQLTPSRRATINAKIEFELEMISTHALTEGDSAAARSFRSLRHFNSRPHGGRLLCTLGRRTRYIFQLTPSRRATYSFAFFKTKFFISTHALTEGDRSCC